MSDYADNLRKSMTPYERIATAIITACMIGFIVLLIWAAI